MCESGHCSLLVVACLILFGRRDVADRLEQAAVITPVDPFERREFDGVERSPRTAAPNDLRLEETDDGFGERVIVRVAPAKRERLGS